MKYDEDGWYQFEIRADEEFGIDGDLASNWPKHMKNAAPIRNWCKENCVSRWYFGLDERGNYSSCHVVFIFQFKNQKDAFAFKLAWL